LKPEKEPKRGKNNNGSEFSIQQKELLHFAVLSPVLPEAGFTDRPLMG
jgi:hypothetical protein